jgi:hypothetical protein
MIDQPHQNLLKEEETKRQRTFLPERGGTTIGLRTNCRPPTRMNMDMHKKF